MSYRRSITLFRFLLAIIVLLVVNLQAAAQPNGPQPPPSDEGQPNEPGRPEKMTFQPPADADSFDDFIPPRAFVVRETVTAQEVAAFNQENLGEARTAFRIQSIPMRAQTDVAVPLADNRLNIIVEKDTFTEQTSLEVRSLSALASNEAERIDSANTPFMHFELEMLNEKQQPIPAFSKYVRLVVDLREYGIDLDETGGYFYLAYEDESEPGKWREVPVTYHGRDGLISAEVAHFSDWQAGWRPEAWALEWRPPSVSEFTGAATYQYPIQVPPGRNGLQPSVGLSYSSASLRGAIQKVSYGSVATGWALNDISITRTGIKNGVYSWTYPDKFRLTINGVGGRLINVGTENGATIYRVEDYPQFKVYNYGGRTWDANQSGNSYWVVRSGDGIYYRLGYTVDSVSEQGTHPLNQPYDYEIIAWHVDTITDSYGNQITYNYFKPSREEHWGYWGPTGNASWYVKTKNSQVTEIAYNFTTRIQTLPPAHNVSRLTSSPASRILFRYENGEDRLTAIEVLHGNVPYPSRRYDIEATTVSNENPSVCDKFDLAYNSWDTLYSSTRVINSIEEQALDPANGNVISQLPQTTFTYQTRHHFVQEGQACFLFEYLSTVENGYGGQSTFTYESDNRVDGSFNNCRGWTPGDPEDPNPPCDQQWPNMGYNYSVKTITHFDGLNPGVKTQYNYSGRCYDQHNNGNSCPQPDTDSEVKFGNIGGYSQVEAVTYDFNGVTPLSKQVTEYHQELNRYGRPEEVRIIDPTTSNLLSLVETDYGVDYFTSANIRFTHVLTTTNTTFDRGDETDELSTMIIYAYDPANQGGQQYGNLTEVKTFADKNDFQPRVTTRNWYFPNETDWLVSQIGATAVYAGASWEMQSGSWFYYDGVTDHRTPPAYGFMTRSRQLEALDCVLLTDSAFTDVLSENKDQVPNYYDCVLYRTIDSQMTKDDFGNSVSTITNSGYGYFALNTNHTIEYFNQFAEETPNNQSQPTTIYYDQQYNLYPVAVENALGQTTTFDIYGFQVHPTNFYNQNYILPVDGFQTQPGLLAVVRDPDERTTTYEYDPFGRLFATYGPEDSQSDKSNPWDGTPANRYRYWDNRWNSFFGYWAGPYGLSSLPIPNVVPQAQADYFFNGKLYQTIWQNGEGHQRSVPLNGDDIPIWTQASAWSDVPNYLPGTGTLQALSEYVIGSTLWQGVWQGDQAFLRSVPIAADGTVQWNNAANWNGPYSTNSLPGSGEIQALSGYVLDDKLIQGLWRGDKGYWRSVEIVGGDVQFPPANEDQGWSSPIELDNYPGQGSISAQSDAVLGSTLIQGNYRGGSAYYRVLEIHDNLVQWGNLPFKITQQTRPNEFPDPESAGANNDYSFDVIQYFDGFGRPFQERQRYVEVEGGSREDVMVLRAYNALGQTACETTPFAVASSPLHLADNCTNWPHTSSEYDSLGRPVTITAPDGSTTSYGYGILSKTGLAGNYSGVPDYNDPNSAMPEGPYAYTSILNAKEQNITQLYNSLGQMVYVTEYTGSPGNWTRYATTTYGYDLQGNLVRVIDAADNLTNMNYDGFGRKTTMQDPDMGNWLYKYDASGNLLQQVDAKNQTMCFSYDILNRLERKAGYQGNLATCPATLPATGGNHLASYSYDPVNAPGQIASVSWGENPALNNETFTYDSLGRMEIHTRIIDGRSYTMQTSEWDVFHRPLEIIYPNNEVVAITYDREGENSLTLNPSTENLILVDSIQYNAQGQMMKFVRGNNIETVYSYYPDTGTGGNSNYRLQSIQHGSTQDNLTDFTYEYDIIGNIEVISATTQINGTDVQQFGYDHLNRLISATGTGTSGTAPIPAYGLVYQYDLIGNIDQVNKGNGWIDYDYTPAPSAPYTHEQPHAVTGLSDGSSFNYDANGNMIFRSDGSEGYEQEFDLENRLVTVTNTVTLAVTTFEYDAYGIRVKTIKPHGAVIYTPFAGYEEELFVETPTPTVTNTPTPTNTPTAANTPTPTNTPTNTPTPTRTPTSTATPSPTPVYDKLIQGVWRNDQGWDRTTPIIGGTPVWIQSSTWSGPWNPSIHIPGSGTIHSQTGYVIGNTLFQGLWRGNQGWSRTVPIVNNQVNWANASAWAGPYPTSYLPGSGEILSESAFVIGSTLHQTIWRGNQGWYRTVPIVNGSADFANAGNWSGPYAASGQPGSGTIQSETAYVIGNTLHQTMWRGNQGWSRTVPIVSGTPNWGGASTWVGPYPTSYLPGSGTLLSEEAFVIDIAGVSSLPATAVVAETEPFNRTAANVSTLLTFLVSMTVVFPLFPPERRSSIRRWFGVMGTWLPVNRKLYKSVLWQALMVLVVLGMLLSLVGLAGPGQVVAASANELAAEPNEPLQAANSNGDLEGAAASVALGPVQSPWVSADIGSVGVAGSADETSGTFTIDAAGANIAGTVDAFHFVYQPLAGDGSITANAVSLSGGGSTPRMGLMMRDGLAADAAHVAAVVQGNRIRVLDRASSGGDTMDVAGYTMGAPEWLRIERNGNTFTLSHSSDGVTWAVMQTRTITMGTTIYVGMAVTGNSTTTLATGVFDNVNVTGGGGGATATPTVSPTPTVTTVTPTATATNTPPPSPTPSPTLPPDPGTQVVIRRVTFSMAGQVVAVKVSGDPVATNNGLFYVYSDHLGSTTAMTNENGAQVGSITRFDPFGNYRTGGANDISDRGFTGHKHNDDIGLIYMNARYYVSGIARFASADTIVQDPTNPQSLNRYTYTFNNPVNLIDPTGHLTEDEVRMYFGFESLAEAAEAFGEEVANYLYTPGFRFGDVMVFDCPECQYSNESEACINCQDGYGYAMLTLFETTTDSETFRGGFLGIYGQFSNDDGNAISYRGFELWGDLFNDSTFVATDQILTDYYVDIGFDNLPTSDDTRYGATWIDIGVLNAGGIWFTPASVFNAADDWFDWGLSGALRTDYPVIRSYGGPAHNIKYSTTYSFWRPSSLN